MKYSSKSKTAFTLVEVLVVIAIIGVLIALVIPRGHSGEPRRMKRCMNNLETILTAIKAYEAKHGSLPEVINDEEGRPLYSWRVAILPYLGDVGKEAHEQIRRDEPWDSEHNVEIQAPVCFRCPSCGESYRISANYALIIDRKPGSGRSPHPVLLETIPAVHWLKPMGLTVADFEKGPPPRRLRTDPSYSDLRFGSMHPGKAFVGMSDGKVTAVVVPPLEKKEIEPPPADAEAQPPLKD